LDRAAQGEQKERMKQMTVWSSEVTGNLNQIKMLPAKVKNMRDGAVAAESPLTSQ
jgi:hypothetical protein